MSTLYLVEQGAKLSKTSERLLVEKDDKVLLEVPAFKVEFSLPHRLWFFF